MARIRSIKPEMAGDEKLATVSRDARLTFVLAMTQADDEGLLAAAPRQLLGTLYPLDESVTSDMLGEWIIELVTIGRLRWRFTKDDARVIEICNWKRHQKIDKPSPSKIRPLLVEFAEPSRSAIEAPASGQRIEAEAEREEEEDQGGGAVDLSPEKGESTKPVEKIPSDRPANSPPLSVVNGTATTPDGLTQAAVRQFVGHFYAEAKDRRKDDVLGQLAGVLTPSGVRFHQNRVKAVDGRHLRDVMLEVTAKPPTKRDSAIVFVLQKLNDTYCEVHSARHKELDAHRRRQVDNAVTRPFPIADIVAGMGA